MKISARSAMLSSPFQHQREHRFLTATLLVATLAPGALLVTAAGLLLQIHVPHPAPPLIVLGAALFVALFVIGILVGAVAWLLIAKRFVHREIIEPYYVYPGVPLFSQLSARLFDWFWPPRGEAGVIDSKRSRS